MESFRMLFTCWVTFGLSQIIVPRTNCAVISIGLLIESDKKSELSGARFAVEYANDNILQTDSIVLTSRTIDPINSAQSVMQHACNLAEMGQVTVIGPGTSANMDTFAPIFEHLRIPVISPTATNPILNRFTNVIHMAPSDAIKGNAIASIFKWMAWKRVNILSSDDEYGRYGLLSFLAIASRNGWQVGRMETFSAHGIINIDLQLQAIKYSGFRIIILNCRRREVRSVMKQAHRNRMTGQGWVWIMTDRPDWDNQVPSNPLPSYMKGMIAIAFHKNNGLLSAPFLEAWKLLDPLLYPGAGTSTLSSNVALWIDAVLTLAYAVRDYGSSIHAPLGLSCNKPINQIHYEPFLQSIKKPGVMQNIQFFGPYPTKQEFNIYNLRSGGWLEVATWRKTYGIRLIKTKSIILPGELPATPDFLSTINGKHFRIVTVTREPFFFGPTGRNPLTLTILRPGPKLQVQEVVHNITLYSLNNLGYVSDGNWGGKNKTTGYWSGVVGQLVQQKADFAFVSLTISLIRERDIDFSYPYMDIGLTVALPKEKHSATNLKFLDPFQMKLWLAVLGTMMAVAFMLNLLEKLSPFGHHGEFIQTYHNVLNLTDIADARIFRRQRDAAFSIMKMNNAIWFSMAALFQQGYDRYPQALSSRVVSIIWFLSVFVMIEMYTAKLGSGLDTFAKFHLNFARVIQSGSNSLWYDNKFDSLILMIMPGFTKDSSVEDFFCQNSIPLYKNMCLKVREWDSFIYNRDDGFKWIADPNYLYAMVADTPIVASLAQKKPCNVRDLGETFNHGGLGIGLQKGSPYTEVISQTILQMRENKFMDHLYTKWFTQRTECSRETKEVASSYRAKFSDLEGIFYIILFLFFTSYIFVCAISPVMITAEFICSCISFQRLTSRNGKSVNFLKVVRYKLGRVVRDFKIYGIPDALKGNFGLDIYEFSRQRQEELTRKKIKSGQQEMIIHEIEEL